MTKDKTFVQELQDSLAILKNINPEMSAAFASKERTAKKRNNILQKVLIANRGEIAKRFFLALHEESIPSVAVVTDADRGQSWYEFADEVVFLGDNTNYTNIPVIISAAELSGANAIYSGYGFLSENPQFVKSIKDASDVFSREIIFMGPDHVTMEVMGDKVSSRALAKEHDVPLFESSEAFEDADIEKAKIQAKNIGYPVIVKLSAGGGGKGMYPVFDESELPTAIESTCRIGKDLYKDSRFYMEKFIQRPIHIEVQVFNGRAIGIRKCAVQRRNQKIVEESGHTFLEDHMSMAFLSAAERLAIVSGYKNGCGAGTVEFLVDASTGSFGFMEMNTRLQVEYAVTDQSLGIDLAKWQILYFDGRGEEIQDMDTLKYKVQDRQHSIEVRIYAEESENDYMPSPGTIIEMDLPTFNGVRADFGFGEGDSILPLYDPMIGKIIAQGATRQEALIRLERSLQELYIKGVKTNINQLLRIVRHPDFIDGGYTNNLLEDNPSLSFQETEEDLRNAVDKRYNQHIIFGAFTEYIRIQHEKIRDFSVISKLKGVMDSPASTDYPYRFNVVYNSVPFVVEFLQTAIDTFHVFVNGVYCSHIKLNSFNDRCDDLLVIYGNKSNRIRADIYPGYTVLRMRDESSKINYYRLQVSPEGLEGEDTAGLLTSPFQGSFVSFVNTDIKVGDRVEEGDALIVLSAMKMETTLEAPISGTISYIIEDGDLSKLQISKTLDGRIIGKSVQEGEVVIHITPDADDSDENSDGNETNDHDLFPVSDKTLDILYRENCEDLIYKEPEKHILMLCELFKANVLGFIPQKNLIQKLKTVMDQVPVSSWGANGVSEMFQEVISHYSSIKRLFSPETIHEGITLRDEMDKHLLDPHRNLEGFSSEFTQLISKLNASYKLDQLTVRPEVARFLKEQSLQLIRLSYQFGINHPDIIRNHIQILAGLRMTGEMLQAMKDLYDQEQSELYDTPARFLKKIIAEASPEALMVTDNASTTSIAKLACDVSDADNKAIKKSLSSPEKKLIADELETSFKERLSTKLELLKRTYDIERLLSIESIHVYRALNKESKLKSYVIFVSCKAKTSTKLSDIIEKSLTMAGCIVRRFQEADVLTDNWIDLDIEGCTLQWQYVKDPAALHYKLLRDRAGKVRQFFFENDLSRGFIDLDVLYPVAKTTERHIIQVCRKEDELSFDLAHKSDKNNPYWSIEDENPRSQKVFNMDKWPVTLWADVCLDPGSIEEIKIPSIDENDVRPVGAHIYTGNINGSKACFYLKDSRMSGGATGDYEGRKYVAACYYAYMKGLPIYVFNDSAGANIKEGVVSLNRGGEGFMVNTLLAENVDPEKFVQYMLYCEDPILKDLFVEMDKLFAISLDDALAYKRSLQLVAIGIGASAGLDVYGSSQATVQIILDNENSYRVLTGSNVIRSVMGEYISNYDIGGAKILGKWTGTVDLVANDKIHLVTLVHELHKLFYHEEELDAIKRIDKTIDVDGHDTRVITDEMLKANVDNGHFSHFKRDYHGSNALIGGFAKLAGRRVLILGARTHSGIRSSKAVRKARDLVRLSHRTKTHQVLLFGKHWLQTPANHENMAMRSRFDFMETLHIKSGVRVNIITDPQGLRCYDVNAGADALILVKQENISESDLTFAEKNATFIVESLSEAFDLTSKLIAYIDPVIGKTIQDKKAKTTGNEPAIPVDRSTPFEVVDSVIQHIFDKDSFLEFYKDMNQPAGPNLVTGLVKLQGMICGVIADQPEIKGGAADAQGTEKFRIFVQFLNRKNIPLVMLSNSSGFVPGSQQERFRIQAIGAESLDENIIGNIPVVSVVLNQNYGGRMIQAFNKFLRPGIVYIALKQACISVMGVDPAFDLFYGKKYADLIEEGKEKEAQSIKDEFYNNYLTKAQAGNDALNTGLVDEVVPSPKDLREYIIKSMALAFERCNKAFGASWPV